mgnify:CR=1 FL=1
MPLQAILSPFNTGDEHIVFDGMPIGHLLSDYWAWNSSDLLINTERGSFSEFIVSSALDLDLSGTREDWGPYDVLFPYQWAQDGVDAHSYCLLIFCTNLRVKTMQIP